MIQVTNNMVIVAKRRQVMFEEIRALIVIDAQEAARRFKSIICSGVTEIQSVEIELEKDS